MKKKKIRKSLEIDEKEERWKESGLIDRDGENGYSVGRIRFNANRNSSLKTSSTCTNIDEKKSVNP